MSSWIVHPEDSGKKLIAFLQQQLDENFSARAIKRAIEENCCEVNGRVERFASHTLSQGDKVSWRHQEKKPNRSITTLYEDDYLLVINKPAGITSEQTEKMVKAKLAHRIDKDTTGVLLLAKDDATRESLFELFRRHEIEKEYLAVVDGIPKANKGAIDNYLGALHHYQGQTIWGSVSKEKGLHAFTAWICEKKGKDFSLLRCYPKTGRTHQIRVHLSSIGHPILGDYQYGKDFKCKIRPQRHLLHAERVRFMHPVTGKQMEIVAPLPSDFKRMRDEG